LPDRLRPLVVVAVALAALGAFALVALRGDGAAEQAVVSVPGAPEAEPFPDPFTWDPAREDEFVERAAAGFAHGIYAFSPGGAAASAERTERWREQVEDAADSAGVDADRLEGLVLLESAGRADALTAAGIEGAAGVAQIVAGTATTLLDMQVDLDRSERLTRRIDRALRRGNLVDAQRLRARRRAVDERFDPERAFPAAGRYLRIAMDRYGREDLAFVSYHMGMGNLDGVLGVFGGDDPSWAEIYFDSTPLRNPATHARLAGFADDSANYLWKVEAAMEVMRLHREDPEELERLAAMHTAKNSAEEVLHPAGTTPVFEDPDALARAWEAGEIVAVPEGGGLRLGRGAGELARRLDVPRSLYTGLRPEAAALALYVAAKVREIAPGTTLRITSVVRDQRYQRLLAGRNNEATRRYSLHTTGWAFDVARDYEGREHALAFQFVLDRLRALNLITWVREPGAIHITASRDAEQLLPLLERAQEAG
jgi:soluble lytic murein transglycosylase-like protein